MVKGDQLFGCLRHTSMAKHECVSPCIFSRTPLTIADLDGKWAESEQGAELVMNFPARSAQLVSA
jgi:hypothetical protein